MKNKRIFTAIIAAALLLGMLTFAAPLTAQASNWGQGDTLEDALSKLKVGFHDTRLDWLVLPGIGVASQRYTYFLYRNERTGTIDEHPVYCIDPTRGGAYEIVQNVGPNSDGSSTATYIRGEKVGDYRYRTIMAAGYPHRQLAGLGLQTKEEGYYATKLALWMYIRGANPGSLTINPAYGDSHPVAQRVRNAAIAIYNDGMAGTPAPAPLLTLTGRPSAVAVLDENGEYYVQGVEVRASSWVGTDPAASGNVQLSWGSPPPPGTIVLDANGGDITSSLGVPVFIESGRAGRYGYITIKYPASAINPKTFVPPALNAEAVVVNDGIYTAYAETGGSTYQRYLVEGDPKTEVKATFVSQIQWKPDEDITDRTGLRIRKLQAGTEMPLAGAVYEVRDPEGRMIYSMATGPTGIIDIPLQTPGNYTVTEVTPPIHHLLPQIRTQQVSVRNGEVAVVTFTNEPYGTLRVAKRDAANGVPLGGATVRIRNIKTNTTQEKTTDSSGNAVFSLLPVGAYEIVEITSPHGYALDATVHTVHVVPLSEGETSYVLTNKANPGLRIIKFDLQTMKPIAGVSFEVWHDGVLIGNYATNALGEIELTDMPAGTYTVREAATVEPYVLDPTVQWTELKAGQGYISQLHFFNLTKPGISLVKVDSATFAPLANARFRVSQVGGPYSGEHITGANGGIDLSGLEPGAYTVQELTAPEGYLIDDATRTIQINAGENAQFVFTNTRKPTLIINKYDELTGERLPGAEFSVAGKGGAIIWEGMVDGNAQIRLENLDVGWYTVTELAAPFGYIKAEPKDVLLGPGQVVEFKFDNRPRPALRLIKVDEQTKQPLAGAIFHVRKTEDNTTSEYITGADGTVTIHNLDEAVYSVVETSAPKGYILDPQHRDIELEWGKVKELVFTNREKPALVILKVDSVTTGPLQGAEFSVKYKDGAVIWEGLTDEDGEIRLYELEPEWYTITEILPPPGYLADTGTRDVLLEPDRVTQIKFDNTRKPVLVFLKTNALTGLGIPGATFRVEYEMPGGGLLNIGSYKTGADGRIIIPQAEPGWYVFTETLPANGFSLPQNPVTRMHFSAGQNAYLPEFDGHYGIGGAGGGQGTTANPPSTSYNIEQHGGGRYYVQGEGYNWPLNSVVIKKSHAITGELLAGAAFELYRADGQVSGVPGTAIGRYTTDNSGIVVITGLEPGYYVVKEVQAPQNFLISENSQQNGYLKADGTTILEFPFANYPYGNLLITKTDARTNAPLSGARFKVTDSSGAVAGSSNGEFTTNGTGEVLITGLKPGAYVVTELAAPEGYAMAAVPQTVDIGTDGKTYSVAFTNEPLGSLVIRKLDGATKEPLAGAEFMVTNADGSVVGTGNGIFTTDATGLIEIPRLGRGSYVVRETKAPDGYVLEQNSETIHIDYGLAYTLTVENSKMSGVQIIKTDASSKQPLKDAHFTVYKQSGEIVGNYVTNGDGVIIIDRLEPGWYKAAETRAPDGYLIDDTPQDFEITANQFIRLVFENAPMSGLLIRKVDADTRGPLEGAEFTVRAASGTLIGIYRSGTDGTAYIPELEPGWYTVTETMPPAGYTLGDNVQTVEVRHTGTVTVEFTNRQFGSLVIKKTDEFSGNPLSGADFTVSHQNGAFVGEYTTGSDGTVSMPSVEPGWYVISETRAPEGYILDSTAKTVEVKPVAPSVVTFTNKPLSGIQIIKTDAVSHAPLPGATFLVERANGERIGTYKTDVAGKIIVPDLTEGAYIVSETIAPDGYILDAAPQTVVVRSNRLTTAEFVNKPLSGIQVIKTDAVSHAPLAGATFLVERANGERIGTYKTDVAGKIVVPDLTEGAYIVSETIAPDGYILDAAPQTVTVRSGRLAVAEFANKPLAGLQIKKIDSATRQPIGGVSFSVSRMGGGLIGEFTTGSDGTVFLPGLEQGWYTIAETKAAEGYIIDGEPRNVEIKWGSPVSITVENTPMSGLLIVKTDEMTGEPLAGVVFDVRRADGQFVSGSILDGNQPGTEANSPNRSTSPNGDITGSYTTDRNGRIQINTLTAGQYHVIERKALDGYELDTDVHAVTITPGQLATLQLTNRQKSGLRILKIDSISKQPIYNVEFMVFDQYGKVVGTYYTDNNGVIDFMGILPEGRYTIRETRAADGYYRDDMPRTVEFKSGHVTEVRWENTPQLAQIQILKKSGDDNEVNGLPAGTPLSGAVFEAYEHKSGNLADRFVSGSNGWAVSRPLPLGRYVIKEVQAPKWYKLSPESLDVDLEFATQIIKMEFLNYSANTGVTIRKTGPAEAMPGDTIRFDIRIVRNDSTVPLTDFYWRDTLPSDAVRLTRIVTGTYNQSLRYKIMATTNKGDTRVIADNLSTTRNNVIDCSNASLGLRNDEWVTGFTLLFGTVKAGFAHVEQPQVFARVLTTLQNGYQFANKADIGGKHGNEWVVGNATNVVTVFKKPEPLPRTGY